MLQFYSVINRFGMMNNMDIFERTALIAGKEAMDKLKNSRVAVFGLGGVGGYVAEALVRSGVGALDFIDADTISETNLNRQIIAVKKTIGMPKVSAAKERALGINPNVKIYTHNLFYSPETSGMFDFSDFDYVVDAVDTVTAKVEIIKKAKAAGVPVISSMGTGNKLRPDLLEVTDIYKTSVCPLARVMRSALRKAGVDSLKVVYSKEKPISIDPEKITGEIPPGKHTIPGSTAFVPAAAGLIIAAEVFTDLTGVKANI